MTVRPAGAVAAPDAIAAGDGDGVRPLRASDVPALLELGRVAIPDTVASRLGPRFAERYHRALLDEPALGVDGYFLDGALVGFVVYSHDVEGALRSAFRRHALLFCLSLLGVVVSPRRLAFVLRIAAGIFGRLPEAGREVRAELLTIAVRRDARGRGDLRKARGIDVPGALIAHALTRLRADGVREVKAFCKPEELDPAANGFIRKHGFVVQGRTTRWGVDTTLYVQTLQPAEEGSGA